ncbi:MAG TPA: hypothetical protein VE988_28060, partial [Gemmataceae bacterium]|nr:hypothetical protein [Gemmataceae bacterium]
MWTPKRILLLSGGLALFIAGYTVYAFFLGGIDGLSPLPEAYGRAIGDPIIPPSADSDVDRKLQLAFGQQCPQMKQPYKFEDRKKGMVVAAAEASFKEPDGRVKLTDFSVAIYKDHTDGSFPEINTITSNHAFLEFDVKIKDPTDMSKGKIIAGELRGNIVIINNHCTPAKHDDLEVLVDNEPLIYEEKKSMIWTNGLVHLLDKQTQPHPTKIDGQGMELHLTKNQPPDKKQPAVAAAPKPKNDLSGVDKIVLKSAVMMHLYPDASSGFMTGAAPPPAKDAKKQAATEKAHVIIKTMGEFVYDITNDVARFDSPTSKQDGAFYDPVEVTRRMMRDEADKKSDTSQDQLICDHLTLKLRRKPAQTGPGKADKSSSDREIESAHATARPGNEVILSLGSENMACTGCQDLVYESPTADRGARTVLRGESLVAAKDGHKIKAKKLELVAANQKGAGQQIIAEGPGQVDLWDRNPGKGYTSHAIWKGLLTSTKLKDGDRDYDLLTLTEDAAFIDDQQGQKLYGQRLQVKLETNDAAGKTGQKQDASAPETRQLPRMVEAFERVRAVSADMRISDCDHLIIRFKDVVKVASLAPATSPAAPLLNPSLQPSETPVAPKAVEKEKEKAKSKQPLDLQARDVVVDVLRGGEKNDLQELLAVGAVHVHQNGETPKDKGVDIKGDTLSLFHFVEGDLLKVFGDTKPAELQLEDLYLLGPKVTINQKDNTAVVEGAGAMRMPSNGSVLEASKTPTPPKGPKEADKTPRTPTFITVHWTKDMLFTGRDADFNGKVEAYQENSTLLCEQLQVAFDKYISLKEGQKGDQGAKVDKVIAYKQVWVLDEEKDKLTDQIKSKSALNCKQLDVNNPDNQSNAYGPGWVAKVGLETGDEFGNPNPQKQVNKAPTKPPQWMLTRIHFTDRMFTAQLNAGKTRQSTFRGAIEVIHVPGDRLDALVDTAKLPPGGMFMQCEVLTVVETMGTGTKSQVMQAEKRVRCWADDIKAVAEVVIFDQTANT